MPANLHIYTDQHKTQTDANKSLQQFSAVQLTIKHTLVYFQLKQCQLEVNQQRKSSFNLFPVKTNKTTSAVLTYNEMMNKSPFPF